MGPGRVIAILGRQHQTIQQVQLRLFNDFGAQPDLRLQMFIVHPNLLMQTPSLQMILDPKDHFRGIHRLVQKIVGAFGQRLVFGGRIQLAGYDENRHIVPGWNHLSQLPHHLESIHVRHAHIERHEIRLDLLKQRHGLTRVIRHRNPTEARLLQEGLHQFRAMGFVVDQ